MKVIGRIISRGEVAGIFIPFKENQLNQGIWQIVEILGEYHLQYIGKSAMMDARLVGLDLNGVFAERYISGLTKLEYNEVCSEDSV